MRKFFIVSDVHSFLTALKETLHSKGFDLNNPEHILVVLGDLFDRGPESKELFNFVRNLPDDRFIYIRGNHEDLLFDCMSQIEHNEIISSYHISNGTVRTIMDLSGLDSNLYKHFVWDPFYPLRGDTLDVMPEVLDYIRNKTIDYYEIGDYILVHGWIPCHSDQPYFNKNYYEFDPNWKNGDWKEARWINGMAAWKAGVKIDGKTIICGHWHTSVAHSQIHHQGTEWGKTACFDIFYDNGIIMLDGCTAYSGIINCIVIDEEDISNGIKAS